MEAQANIAQDLFYKIRSRFSGLKLGAESGEVTILPHEARFFDFNYQEDDKVIGHVSISLAEPTSMKVYFSNDITKNMNRLQKNNWYKFLQELRSFAKRRLLSFDTRDIAKDNLDQRDYAFLSKSSQSKNQSDSQTIAKPVGESLMNEHTMYGTKNTSYQKLMDTRLIIKHSRTLNDDLSPGDRSRNISALFVENHQGERFKYPYIHLAGARAMQRHVANGGVPYDDVGKSIIGMSEQISQLKLFSNYVTKNNLMNSETNSIVERSSTALGELRDRVGKLAKQSHYENYKENFQVSDPIEVPDTVIEEFIEKFTVKDFKEDIKTVFPVLYKLMQEESTVDYDDIVSFTESDSDPDEGVPVITEYDPFEAFENWALSLGESSAIASDDPEERTMAIQQLQKLMNEEFPAGVDGSNAIESITGIIQDNSLFASIREIAQEDPQADVRPLIKAWMEENAEEAMEYIDFDSESADDLDDDSDDDQPADDLDDDLDDSDSDDRTKKNQTESFDTNQLAEFIHSFYDRNTKTFPKGPEGVCSMVGKKFGEQAEHAARQFVERMAPHQVADSSELEELARLKQLSGLQNEVLDHQSFREGENLKELRDAIDDNQIVKVAFVKKDGTVSHMAIRKGLSSYRFSDKPKTDRQASVEQNHNLKRVINISSYQKELKKLRDSGMSDDEAKPKAAAKSWRSVNLGNVLGFMVGSKFFDLRDENDIKNRFGDDVYNSLTPAMQRTLSQNQPSESFNTDFNNEEFEQADTASAHHQQYDQELAAIKKLSGI